jgi:hypothetical protein
MSEFSNQTDPDAEARAKIEADVSMAVAESFEAHSEDVKVLEGGVEHLTLYVSARGSDISEVVVDRMPVGDDGIQVTDMSLTPIAQVTPSRLRRGGITILNGQVHANAWRLTEGPNQTPRFEPLEQAEDGTLRPATGELMQTDETVAAFGRYWPANLRQGKTENPLRKRRVAGRYLGKFVLKDTLDQLKHTDYNK